MHPSIRHFQYACRITLFTRANCSLCTNAKQILSNVWDCRPFEYKEIEVMKPMEKKWKDLYEFDTPVIHVGHSKHGEEQPEMSSKAYKLMHRFDEEQVKTMMDKVETDSI